MTESNSNRTHLTDLGPITRTRKWIVFLGVLPTSLFLVALFVPKGDPVDVIAVVTLLIWVIGYPSLVLIGFVLSWAVRGATMADYLTKRIVRAICFSVAALLVVGDFWAFGVFAGRKSDWLIPDLTLMSVAVVLTLLQFPTNGKVSQWTSAATTDSPQHRESPPV